MPARNDSRPTPPRGRYALPNFELPTPNVVADYVIVENVPIGDAIYTPLLPGTPHPDYPAALLINEDPQQSSGREQNVTRTYATKRYAQNAYNAVRKWLSESTAHPTYVRTFTILRSLVPDIGIGVRGQPLKEVVSIKLTASGSGYHQSTTTATISGGSGTGATASVQILNGAVVGILLTNGGSGYITNPTVVISDSAGGLGATATAAVQPQTAILTEEDIRPAEGPMGSIFDTVTQLYETIPGPEVVDYVPRPDGTIEKTAHQKVPASTVPAGGAGIMQDTVQGLTVVVAERTKTSLVASDGSTAITTDAGYTLRDTDPQTLALIGITYRVRPYNATPPVIGSPFGVGSVIHYQENKIEGSTNVIQIIRSMELPSTFVEYPDVAVTFPGIFRTSIFFYDFSIGLHSPPPWPGDGVTTGTYYLLHPRQKKVQGRVVNTFSLGPSGNATVGYQVYTPGVASKLFNIPNDTVHPPIKVYEVNDGTNYVVENIPASTPVTYNSRQILSFPMGETRYQGNIYWRKVLQVSEDLNPYDFPALREAKIFQAASSVDLAGQPNPSGERLILVSTNAGDTMAVTIIGQRNNSDGVHYTSETVSLTGTTRVQTSATYVWFAVTQVHLASSPAGTVTVRGQGTVAAGAITVTAMPLDGQTLTIGKPTATRTYTFRKPSRKGITCPAGSALVTGASPGSYLKFVLNGNTDYFWFSNGTTTDPAPGGTGHAVTFTAGDANTVIAASLLAAMNGLGTLASSVNVASITTTAIALGVITLTQDAGASFTITSLATGTADAADQIRISFNTDGTTMTNEQLASIIAGTLNGTAVSGQEMGTGTTAHADILGIADGTSTLSVESRDAALYGITWTLSTTASNLTLTAITDGSNGPLIASLTGSTDSYNDISFNNLNMLAAGVDWTEEQAQPHWAVVNNIPAFIGLVTSDAIYTHDKKVTLRIMADGKPALAVSYEISNDGVTGWTAGATSLSSVGNRALYQVVLGETTIKYIRLKITNSGSKARAVHADVVYDIT